MKYPELETGTDNNTVVFDFDGVLAEPLWPQPGIGDPILEGIEMLRHYQKLGFRIIIHTSRHWGDMEMIRAWLVKELGYHAAGVVVVCGKPLAQLYVDDRALRFERWRDPTLEEMRARIVRVKVNGEDWDFYPHDPEDDEDIYTAIPKHAAGVVVVRDTGRRSQGDQVRVITGSDGWPALRVDDSYYGEQDDFFPDEPEYYSAYESEEPFLDW